MGQTGEVLPLPGLLYVALSVPVTSGEGPRGAVVLSFLGCEKARPQDEWHTLG